MGRGTRPTSPLWWVSFLDPPDSSLLAEKRGHSETEKRNAMTEPSQSLAGLSLAEKRRLLEKLLQEKAKQGQSLYPLSHGQRGLWFLYQMDRHDSAYNIFFPSRLRSRIDLSALRRLLQLLIDRHPCLRTTFEERNGELLQRVHDQMPVVFQTIDASGWSEDTLHNRLVEESHRPFDLEQGPLIRPYLFSRSAEDHLFLLTAHHIIGDFWSLVVILEEMQALYPALCLGASPTLPPLKKHYRDFVRWQAEMLAGPRGNDSGLTGRNNWPACRPPWSCPRIDPGRRASPITAPRFPAGSARS